MSARETVVEYSVVGEAQTESVADNFAVRLSGNVYVLEGTAVDIWKIACAHGRFTSEEVCAALCDAYNATAEQITDEVEEFLSRLLQWQLIRVSQN